MYWINVSNLNPWYLKEAFIVGVFSGQQVDVLALLAMHKQSTYKCLSLKITHTLPEDTSNRFKIFKWMTESHLLSMLMWFHTLNCLLIAVKLCFLSSRVYTFALIIIRAGHFLDNCKHWQFIFKFMHKDIIGTINFILYERCSIRLIHIFYAQPMIDVPDTNKFCLKNFTVSWFSSICIWLHFLSSVRTQLFLGDIKLSWIRHGEVKSERYRAEVCKYLYNWSISVHNETDFVDNKKPAKA